MNWEMISALGQLVAAVGVIPSLIYLAIQIREQNKERRRAAVNILTAQWGDLVKSTQEMANWRLFSLPASALSRAWTRWPN